MALSQDVNRMCKHFKLLVQVFFARFLFDEKNKKCHKTKSKLDSVAKGLKMTKFGSNSTNVQVVGNNTSASTAGSGDRTGNQSIATSNTSGTSSCHHHYHHHYPPKHRRTGSGKNPQGVIQKLC